MHDHYELFFAFPTPSHAAEPQFGIPKVKIYRGQCGICMRPSKKEIIARNAEADPLVFAIFSTVPMAKRAQLHPPRADIWSWEASPRV